MNISSATGRRPVAAAPTAVPRRPISLIGVSSTRSGRSAFDAARVVVPRCRPSRRCPRRRGRRRRRRPRRAGSRRDRVAIAMCSASLIACTDRRACAPAHGRAPSRRRRSVTSPTSGSGAASAAATAAAELGAPPRRRCARSSSASSRPPRRRALLEARRSGSRCLHPALGLLLGAVRERVADEVAAEAIGLALEQRRALAARARARSPRPPSRRRRRSPCRRRSPPASRTSAARSAMSRHRDRRTRWA